MPLDRLISIGIRGPDGSEDGTPVPGEIVDRSVWARQVDYRFQGILGGSQELRTERRYRVRYRPDIVDAFLANRLSVVIDGDRYQVETVTESAERRKWLDISVFLSVS